MVMQTARAFPTLYKCGSLVHWVRPFIMDNYGILIHLLPSNYDADIVRHRSWTNLGCEVVIRMYM